PRYIKEEDIPADVIEHESQIAAAKAREEGKAEAVIPRIVEGSLKKFKDESVLLRQVYIRDEELTIQQLLHTCIAATGENIVIRRFARWELGESTAE
ncbi:MAG TPA: elongation factor Ts, partial [Anaerolineaceae bacterium]|nr:elongation factor Ts [Anaerolineaceae bacterium]